MIVTAREFSTGAEMRAAAAAVRQRLLKPKTFVKETEAPPVVKRFDADETFIFVQPSWKSQPIMFDEHIIAWRIWTHDEDMRAAGLAESGGRRPIIEIVRGILTSYPDVTVAQIKGATRMRRIVEARQLAMHAVRMERFDLSYPTIGKWFGGRDHTTVMHAVHKIEKMRGAA